MQNGTRISGLFSRLRQQGRPGLVAYITAGDPTLERTPELVFSLEAGGADVIELGVPFSDPIADGPVIQRASDRALRNRVTIRGVLAAAQDIRKHSNIPLVLFTYMNPVLRYGIDKLAADAASAGIDGCLMTDLSVEEAGQYVDVMRKHNLDTVFLAAPTSTERRLQLVAQYSSGFVYLVSRTGVTGERESVSAAVGPLVRDVRRVTQLPLAVGFGISTPDQVSAVAALADAVVVGSALVRLIERNGHDVELENKLEHFTRELCSGLYRGAR